MEQDNNCLDCKYCLQHSWGYSNYTVEGTTVFCLKKLNPDLPKDRWYREEPALKFAESCESFSYGGGIEIEPEDSCDEIQEDLDGELLGLFVEWREEYGDL